MDLAHHERGRRPQSRCGPPRPCKGLQRIVSTSFGDTTTLDKRSGYGKGGPVC
jgi:hypothetical protein